MPAARSSKLAVGPGGKLHSKKSKTGDPKCSAAVSAWVLGRKGGTVGPEVYATLASCRAKSRQNKSAAAKQASGKLAEGRGTWQRSEKAVALKSARPVAAKPAPAAPAPAQAQGIRDRMAARSASHAPAPVMSNRGPRNPFNLGAKVTPQVPHGVTLGSPDPKIVAEDRGKIAAAMWAHRAKLAAAKKASQAGSVADVVTRARAVHAANPGPEMTTHAPHATNAAKADGGFHLAGESARGRAAGPEFFNTGGKGHGGRAPLFGLDDLPTNSARGQASLFGGRVRDPNAGVSGTTGRTVEVGADGQHRLPGDFGKPRTQGAKLSAMPRPVADAAPTSSREGRLAAIVGRLRKRAPKAPAPTADPATHTDHAPGHVGMLNADLIHVDAGRFQYKIGYGEGGSVGSLAGVRKYDPELGGVLQVWKDHADGKVYVVNGHNRLDLARKLGAQQVTARFVEAKDHHEARAKGALTNIAEGRGTATDAAKFFRDTGRTREELEARGIPLREKVATDGIALSKLSKPIFDRVTSGAMSPERGAIIGGSGLEHHEQAALVKLLDDRSAKRGPAGGEVSNATLRELTDTVRSSRSVRSKSSSLFGDSEDDASLALHKAKLQATIKDRLSKEKRLFGIVAKSKHAEDLARAGNSINVEASGEVSHAAAITLHAFDSLKNLSGPVSRRLNDAAEKIHANPKEARKHTDEAYRGILADLPEFLAGTNQFHH